LTIYISCNEDSFNESDFLAGEAFTESNIRVMLIDTMTIRTSTMKFDSVITSSSSRMLVGKYTDPIFGTVQSSSYLSILAEYDSISMILNYDKYYYSDTLQSNTIHIKRLNETLKPHDDDYYNTNTFDYVEDDLGSLAYHPRPSEGDSLEIILSDSLGTDFFEKLQEKTITNSDEFKDYFKGIVVLPDEDDNGSVIGFSSGDSFIRLYFSIAEEEERVQYYVDFVLNTNESTTPLFNNITSEDPLDYLQILTDKETNLDSSDSDNLGFIQSGIGIATRIEFPFVKSVYEIKGEGTILDAVLKIRPAYETYSDQLILRDTLSVYVVDKNNDLTEQLTISDSEPVLAILNRDNQEFNDVYYEIPLGSYIEKLLLAERTTNEALILLPSNYSSTVDRFVLNGYNDLTDNVVLQLIYAVYDEDE